MKFLSFRAGLVACSLCAAMLPLAVSAAPADGRPHPVVRGLDRAEHLLDNAANHPRLADRDLDRAMRDLRRVDAIVGERQDGDHDPLIDQARQDMRAAEVAIDAHNMDEAREDVRKAAALVEQAVDVRQPDPTPTPDAAPSGS